MVLEPRYLDLNIGLRRFNFCVDVCVSVCGEAGLGWAGLEGVFSIFDYFRNPMLHTHWALGAAPSNKAINCAFQHEAV